MLLGRCSPACYRLCATVQPQGTPSPWKIFQHFPGPRSGLLHLDLRVLITLLHIFSCQPHRPPQLLREQSPTAYTQTTIQWLPPLWHSLLNTMSSVTVRSQSAAMSRGLSLTTRTRQFHPIFLSSYPVLFDTPWSGGGEFIACSYTNLHIREPDYGQPLLFSASSSAPWTVPGLSRRPGECTGWVNRRAGACSRNQSCQYGVLVRKSPLLHTLLTKM